MEDAPDFTSRGYAALVRKLQGQGYTAVDFTEAKPEQPHLILRHDIDISVSVAAQMAEIEAELGVRSRYFVLIRSELYNAFDPVNANHLRGMAKLGHRISLHFDSSLYGQEREAQEGGLSLERKMLEDLTGLAVDMFSYHRPPQLVLAKIDQIAGCASAYSSAYFTEIGYCSDSEGRWRFGPPLEHAAVREHRALHLLTHPVWWIGDTPLEPAERLEGLARARDAAYRRSVAANCRVFPGS